MSVLTKCVLLFVLNWLDAQLTLFWVRAGLTTEANPVMAVLLDHGDYLFLLAKIAVGLFAALVLYRWSHRASARRGTHLVLGVYACVMLTHAATGALALGWHEPQQFVATLLELPHVLLALF